MHNLECNGLLSHARTPPGRSVAHLGALQGWPDDIGVDRPIEFNTLAHSIDGSMSLTSGGTEVTFAKVRSSPPCPSMDTQWLAGYTVDPPWPRKVSSLRADPRKSTDKDPQVSRKHIRYGVAMQPVFLLSDDACTNRTESLRDRADRIDGLPSMRAETDDCHPDRPGASRRRPVVKSAEGCINDCGFSAGRTVVCIEHWAYVHRSPWQDRRPMLRRASKGSHAA